MKQFTHSELDRASRCDWSFTHENEDDIVNVAAEHLLNCDKGFLFRNDSNLLRTTIRAVIRDEDFAHSLDNLKSATG